MGRWLLGGLLLLGLAAPLQAGTARSALEAFIADVTALDSRFNQTVSSVEGGIEEESQGSVSLALPRRFRFEYEAPWPQLILADGERVWIYDPELEQASVRAQASSEAQSPLLLILEPAALDQGFEVEEGGAGEGLQWLLLTPREERADFSRLDLGFADGQLRAMRYVDPGGQVTALRFEAWRRDPPLPPGHFQFEPPAGVDVIGLEEIESGSAQVQGLGD